MFVNPKVFKMYFNKNLNKINYAFLLLLNTMITKTYIIWL